MICLDCQVEWNGLNEPCWLCGAPTTDDAVTTGMSVVGSRAVVRLEAAVGDEGTETGTRW